MSLHITTIKLTSWNSITLLAVHWELEEWGFDGREWLWVSNKQALGDG